MIFFRVACFVLVACSALAAIDRVAAQEIGKVYPLWPAGAPGSESRKDEPETSGDWWVANIHHPTLTAFLPEPDKRNGDVADHLPRRWPFKVGCHSGRYRFGEVSDGAWL